MKTKEFKLESDARITSKVYAYVCNVGTDLQIYPVDLKFKLNNLSRPEFIAYANKVMNLPRETKAYATEKERTREFFHFYNLNKHLIEGETKPSYEQLENNTELLQLYVSQLEAKVTHLSHRIENAAAYFRKYDEVSKIVIDEILEAGKQTKKGVNIIVK